MIYQLIIRGGDILIDFRKVEPIKCDVCGKNLHESLCDYSALVAWSTSADCTVTEDVYFACKAKCDEQMSTSIGMTSWEDLSDLAIPTVFVNWVLSTMSKLHDGHKYSEKAFEKLLLLIANMVKEVMREMTVEEERRFSNLSDIANY